MLSEPPVVSSMGEGGPTAGGELGGEVMPDYDFECAACGKKFTKQQTYEEHDRAKRVKCPKCGSQRTRRVIGSVFAKTSKKSWTHG